MLLFFAYIDDELPDLQTGTANSRDVVRKEKKSDTGSSKDEPGPGSSVPQLIKSSFSWIGIKTSSQTT